MTTLITITQASIRPWTMSVQLIKPALILKRLSASASPKMLHEDLGSLFAVKSNYEQSINNQQSGIGSPRRDLERRRARILPRCYFI